MAFLHLFFLVSLLLTLPHLSLSQSQISLPPSFPPTSTFSSSDPLASPPDLSVSIPPSFSPFASSPALSPSSSDLLEAPAPSPVSFPVPAPTPSYVAMEATSIDTGEGDQETEKKGLDGHKKAGIVVGVFSATAIVGLGVLVCKRRQENIRRSTYGYSSSSRVQMV